jgi:hypothetical protein
MPAPASAIWFRINTNGSLTPIEDVTAAQSAPGDFMLAVTGVPSGVSYEALASLLYLYGALPLDWRAGAKWTVPYFNLITPNVVPLGSITFTVNPTATNTLTIGTSTWTFVSSGATGNQTNIGANLAATLTTLVTNLNASADAQVVQNTYAATATVLTVTSKTAGTSKNGFVLGTNVSGAVATPILSGGSITADITTFTIP